MYCNPLCQMLVTLYVYDCTLLARNDVIIWIFFWKLNFYSLSTVFLHDFWSLYVIQEIHDGLDFSSAGDENRGYSFGIFSVKFSTDGREVVAGSSDDSIYVYDLEANKPSLQISAHSVLLPFA